MQYQKYDPSVIEPAILDFWEKNGIYHKIKQRNEDGKSFYFLDGPPYTSGKVHIGTAWNKSMKDLILRYKRMQGFNVWDRAGYDMHGLPVEHATEKKLGIKGNQAIVEFGVDKFVEACKKLSTENLTKMNEEFIRLGVWMDFENAYQSITNDFIDGEWWLIKQAHEKGRLYEGLRTMHWDTASSTGVAKHELEYKSVTDDSVYVKFALKDEPNMYLIVWTTTPWTLPFNLAVMVNPSLTYVKADVGGETWIVAKALAGNVIKEVAEKEYSVKEEVLGEKLEGLEYVHPFHGEIPFDGAEKMHTVVLSTEYVDDSSGTGLVHTAPGCGPEDYEVGHRNGLKPFNSVDENGVVQDCGPFTGLRARKDDVIFREKFEEKGVLVATKKYTHDYPHDWRSHEPVIFRTTKQWFFKVEDLKEKMIEANNSVKWVPEAGYNAFNSWLENLRDNSISKQRFWGTPLPIWRNVENEEDYIVVGSLGELKELSGVNVDEPHKPWIDTIEIVKNGKTYRRVPDVLDVWVDAGTVSWNCLDYPKDEEHFGLFPADFILEGKDQIRGWFNLLMVASFLALDKPSFKAVYMHGFVTDVSGVKMSKSLGNIISPDQVVDKYGADVLRYYMAGTSAGEDNNFSWEEIGLKHRNLNVLWNVHKLLLNLAKENSVNPYQLDAGRFDVPEKYIFSKLYQTINAVTDFFDQYRLDEVIKPVEDLFLGLSRTYIQLIREKSSVGSVEEKNTVLFTLGNVLLETLKLFAPIAPFVTEAMYQNLREAFDLEEESVHLFAWPESDDSLVDQKLEKNMGDVDVVMQAISHGRELVKMNVRWPLKEVVVVGENVKTAVEELKDIIMTQVNIKSITVVPKFGKEVVKINFSKIKPRYGDLTPQVIAHFATKSKESILEAVRKEGAYRVVIEGVSVEIGREDLIVTYEGEESYHAVEFKGGVVFVNTERSKELDAEGYSREIMRRVQSLRKKAGLEKVDKIVLYLKTSDDLKAMLDEHVDAIARKVGASKIKIDLVNPVTKHEHVSEEKVKDEDFVVYF
jgi:isoleucyl-tRNA synthetase